MPHLILENCTGCTACAHICPTQAITGVRSELHHIDPRICIDCGVCGLICPVAAVMDNQGLVVKEIKRSQWRKPVVLPESCVSCGACLQMCPVDVLAYRERENGNLHLIPYLKDEKGCIACSFCESACPVRAIRIAERQLA